MIGIVLIFISMSLGVLFEVSVGSMNYNFEFIEPALIAVFIYVIIHLWNKNKYHKMPGPLITMFFLLLIMFSYSLLTLSWTNYGLSVLPGSIVFFYGVISIFIANYYFQKNSNVYTIVSRIFVLIIIIQLFVNIYQGVDAGVTGFYDLKDYARTLIGKSNFISIFIAFDLIYEFISKDKHWVFFLLIDLVAIIFTISRGAIVTVVLALAVFFIIAMFNKNFNRKSILISISILILTFTIFMLSTSPGRELLKGLSAGLGANTVSTRQVLWKEAFSETIANPMGVGIVWRNDPHNFIFSSLRNLGFVFGTLYIMIIASPLFLLLHPIILRLSKKSIGLIIAYLSVFIHSFIEVFYFTKLSVSWSMFTIVFIFIMVMKDIKAINGMDNSLKKYGMNNNMFNKIKPQAGEES